MSIKNIRQSIASLFTSKSVQSLMIVSTVMVGVAAVASPANADLVKMNSKDLCLHKNDDNSLAFRKCNPSNQAQNWVRTPEDIKHVPTGQCVGRNKTTIKNFDKAILQPCNVSPSILFGKGEYYLWGNPNFALDAF
jgi:hypothetical protein